MELGQVIEARNLDTFLGCLDSFIENGVKVGGLRAFYKGREGKMD